MQSILRKHLLYWLQRNAGVPLRAVIAPYGFGKTTLLRQYAQQREACRYVSIGRLRRPTDPLPAILCERLGLPVDAGRSVEAAIAALDALPPCEIAIDEVDYLRDEERDALSMILLQAPQHVSLILAARSREMIGDPRRLLDGSTAMLDISALALATPEITELCAVNRVEATQPQIAQLLEESEGWPVVVAGAVRVAAERESDLSDAIQHWSARCGAALRETITSDAAESALGPALMRLCTAEGRVANDELRALERAGLYVRRVDRGYALLRVAAETFAPQCQDPATLSDLPPIFVQLLGEFEVRIGGRRVEWVRRKDALLFKYLLLEPLGRASRRELAEAFWPTHDRQQAAQNLRTTCSNIRSALRRVLQSSRADLYFQTDGRDITLRNDLAVTDLARFRAFVQAAREAMSAQLLDKAVDAYEAARAAYRGPLIADPPTPPHEAVAREIDESFNEVQRHLTALRRFGAGSTALGVQAGAATA